MNRSEFTIVELMMYRMEVTMETIVNTVGWIGSVLLVVSILQSNLARLRWLSLTAAVVLTVYNGIIGIWPMVAMNIAVAIINVFYLADSGRRQGLEALEPIDDAREPQSGSHEQFS